MNYCPRTLFVSPLKYALCLDAAEFAAELKRLKAVPVEFVGNGYGLTHKLDLGKRKPIIIVCLNMKKKDSEESKRLTITHEAVHVWQYIKEFIGEQTPADEQEAYAIERIVKNLMESYRKQTARSK